MSFEAVHWLWLALPAAGAALLARRRPRGLLEAAALVLVALALARPQRAPGAARAGSDEPPLLFVLDASRSMLARDVAPSRFDAARERIAAAVAREPGRRIGVVAFAGEAWTVAPPTADHAALREILAGVEPSRVDAPGSDARAGLARALALLERIDASAGSEVVVLGDGEWEGEDAQVEIAQLAARGARLAAESFGGTPPAPIEDPEQPGAAVEFTQAQPEAVAALGAPRAADAAGDAGEGATSPGLAFCCALLAFACALASHVLGGREP